MERARLVTTLSLAGLLAGCPAAPSRVVPPTKTPKPAASQPPGVKATPGPVAATPPPAIVPNLPGDSPLRPAVDTGVVSQNGASLAGSVKAPPAFVSDQGGGVVANNGGSYRLSAVAQQPLAGATVKLTDADGRAIVDPTTKQPLTAQTGPDGRYAFTQALPNNALLLEVELPGGKGVLRAIAPGDAAARAATDVELVATLTSAYIVQKYVRSQALDPQVTLDKLPAAIERETRLKAEAALSGGAAAGVPLPVRLTDAESLATVEALRGKDAGLDAQLEVVKNLLVAAGLDDLGAGRLATEVGLRAIRDVATTPDGTVYFTCSGDERVWRLDAQGRLVTAAGLGPSDSGQLEPVDGKPGPQAKLWGIQQLQVDAQGRLIIVEHRRVTRLEPDGRLKQLVEKPGGGKAGIAGVVPRADGGLLVLTRPELLSASGRRSREEPNPASTTTVTTPAALWRVAPDGAIARLGDLNVADSLALKHVQGLVPAADGGLRVDAYVEGTTAVRARWASWRMDPATGALVGGPTDRPKDLASDDTGAAWTTSADQLKSPAGATFKLAEEALGIGLNVAPLPGGGAVVGDGTKLWKLGPGAPTLIAGLLVTPDEADAGSIPFEAPTQLTVDPQGQLRVFDEDTRRMWRIVPGGRGRVVATLPEEFELPDEETMDLTPLVLRATSDGATWILVGDTDQAIFKLAPDGKLTLAWQPPDTWMLDGSDTTLKDFLVADDGTLTLLTSRWQGEDPTMAVETVKPGQAGVRKRIEGQGDGEDEVETYAFARIAPAPGGGWYLADGTNLALWKPGTRPQTIGHEDDEEGWWQRFDERDTYLAADPRGRLYGTDTSGVWQFDPVTRLYQTIAGYEGLAFQGAGVNDGAGSTILAPVCDAAGNLYFLDPDNRQVKRIEAGRLP